jgi:hypothetical protein
MLWEPKAAFTALSEYYGALEHQPEIKPPLPPSRLSGSTAAFSAIASDELHNVPARVVINFFP